MANDRPNRPNNPPRIKRPEDQLPSSAAESAQGGVATIEDVPEEPTLEEKALLGISGTLQVNVVAEAVGARFIGKVMILNRPILITDRHYPDAATAYDAIQEDFLRRLASLLTTGEPY